MSADGEVNGSATNLLIRIDERLKTLQAQHSEFKLETQTKLIELSTAVAKVPSLVDALAEIKPEVERSKKDRWMRVGVAVGGVGGTAGLYTAIKGFFAGLGH